MFTLFIVQVEFLGDCANKKIAKEYSNTLNLSITAYSPVQKEGCSDREYGSSESSGDVVSEFRSTPDTSVESTPEPSPQKEPQLSTSTGNIQVQSRGKDFSLLMKLGQSYQTPSESLYFREMVKTKTTPKQNSRKSDLAAKQDREKIPATLLKKSGPRIKYTARKQNQLRKSAAAISRVEKALHSPTNRWNQEASSIPSRYSGTV